MASYKKLYLGGYIVLPPESLEHQWYDLTHEIGIHVDDMRRVPGSCVVISNYTSVNYADEDAEVQVLEMDADSLTLMKLKFEVTHAKSLAKLSEYFKEDFEIKAGLVTYWN